ncbi:MAG: S8 family peptidase [Candidatus Metalachnospira sp.]|nr:S8 family peptidase [Candidatus Metalachnospira sp.]
MAIVIDENELPLEDFVKLPTTIDFNVINTDRFKLYVRDKPYIKLGTEFANELVAVYTNANNIPKIFQDLGHDFLGFFPKIMSPLDSKSNEASGISAVLDHPYINLDGSGVIIGFVDTGIDYTKDAFKFDDGSTKIINIWDQTIDGPRTSGIYFGSVYSADEINVALQSEDPLSIVPSADTDGHGTFLASVASSNDKGEYIGAAPKSNIISVKLRRARQYYIDKFLLPQDNPNLYESTDYLLGVKYILDKSEELNMPVVICVGMGTNFSGHDGSTYFEDYIAFVAQRIGYAFVTAAGNESNTKHHTQGKITKTGLTDSINFNVGIPNTSFTIIILSPPYDKISVSITSPTGEVVARVPFRVGLEYREKFTFEFTTVSIEYHKTTNSVIFLGFEIATQGIWEITLFGDDIINGEYHAWLPITGQVSEYVEFLRPVPEFTIVSPATAIRTITCGAYNSLDNSLFVSSSWGPTLLPRMAPDFVAPGVNVKGIYPTGPGTMTGTSVSAAVTSGASALLLQWGIVQGNLPSIDGDLVRTLLISGCNKESSIQYPNNKWGYGKLNLIGTMGVIKESVK